MVSRRGALRLLGGSLIGAAGCTNPDSADDANPTVKTTRSTDTPAPTPTETATPTPREPTVEVHGTTPTWSREFGGPIRGRPALAGKFLVTATDERVVGLDQSTGETVWSFEPPAVPERDVERLDATLRVRGGVVYALLGVDLLLGGRNYSLHALDPDGTERWRYATDIGRWHTFAGFGDGAVVLVTSDDSIERLGEHVLAVDLDDGRERWRAETGDAFGGAVGNGVVATQIPVGFFDCYALESGDRRFRFEIDESASTRAVAVGDDLVFAGVLRFDDRGPSLYALDSADGEPIWTWSDADVDSLRLLDDLYVGGESIYRLGPDGAERWRYDGGGPVGRVPFDEERLYTTTGTRLVAINRRDGTEAWSLGPVGSPVPTAKNGDVLLAGVTVDGRMGAYDVDGGRRRWLATSPDQFLQPTVGGDSTYLATDGGTLLKLSA